MLRRMECVNMVGHLSLCRLLGIRYEHHTEARDTLIDCVDYRGTSFEDMAHEFVHCEGVWDFR